MWHFICAGKIQHFTFTIGETPYTSLVDHSISLSTLSVPTVGANESLPMLATAIHGCSTEALDTFYEDDVWSPEFLENIYLLPDENCTSLSMSPRNQSVSILPSLQAAIPEGPYVIVKDVFILLLGFTGIPMKLSLLDFSKRGQTNL